jgi:hypothetical protein
MVATAKHPPQLRKTDMWKFLFDFPDQQLASGDYAPATVWPNHILIGEPEFLRPTLQVPHWRCLLSLLRMPRIDVGGEFDIATLP